MALSRINAQSIADGTIVAADIANGSVTNAKLAGSITFDKITSVSNTAISGVIEASQLANTLNLSSKTVTLPAGTGGKVLQVVSVTKTDTFTTSSNTFVDVTGLSVSITPSNASNKILVIVNTSIGQPDNGENVGIRLVRNSTVIYAGDTSSNRPLVMGIHIDSINASILANKNAFYLDSPNTTSSTTYKLQGAALTGGVNSLLTINRSGSDPDNNYGGRTASSITVMEIAA
jgi:hypothetical protein